MVTSTIQYGVSGSSEGLSLRALRKVCSQEDLNFLVTNRIPRRYATLLMGWLSGNGVITPHSLRFVAE